MKGLRMRQLIFAFFVFALLLRTAALAQTSTATASQAGLARQRLERELARLAKPAGGTVGVSAVHIETGRRVSLNGAERFPMASVYKIPIAVQLLARVDEGQVRLDRMIELKPSDLRPGTISK